jgi:hypothetical protein
MATSNTFQVQPRQHDPALWIERFVIFEKVEPLTPIREIGLRRGVNVIWAVEQEEASDAIGPTEVAGHSAGKTTLCRLLRYCLGEERFGTEDGQKLIRYNLVDGYVGAHVWLEGKRWAVARPIGAGNRHYAAPDLSVEELLEARTHANEFSNFLVAIDHALISPLQVRQNPRTGQPIHWKHILAWCARDQESHYEDVWSWRSSRSSSESLGFDKPKVDAVFVMRVLLGLVAGDEPAALQTLKEKETERDNAIKDVAEARREPEYWDRHLTNVLYSGLELASDVPLEASDLFQTVSIASRVEQFQKDSDRDAERMDAQLEQLEREVTQMQRERPQIIRELNDCLALLAQQQAGAEELQAGRVEVEQTDDNGLTELWTCPYSQKLVKDVECWSLYEERRERRALVFSAAATDLRDAGQLATRQRAITDLRGETARLTAQAEQSRVKLKNLNAKRDQIKKDREAILRRADSYTSALVDLRDWRAILAGNKPHPRIAPLVTTLAERERAVKGAQERVLELLKSHKTGRQRLTTLFERVVKAVLSKRYGGNVTLSEEDLRFDITRGPALGGEAVNILSVLLADVTSLIASIEGTGFQPRFLIHDSPREADLARHIYWNFLGLMFDLERSSSDEKAPTFQYIVTTTTPPPPTMRGKPPVQETLNASQEKGLLFGRVLLASENSPLISAQ